MGLFSALRGKKPDAQVSIPNENTLDFSTPKELYMYYCKLFHITPYIDQLYFMSHPDEDLVNEGLGIVGVCNDGYIYFREYGGNIAKIRMDDIINIDIEDYAITTTSLTKFEFPLCKFIVTTNDNIVYYLTLENNGENSDSARFESFMTAYLKREQREFGDGELEAQFEFSVQQNKMLFTAGGIDEETLYPMDRVVEAYYQKK